MSSLRPFLCVIVLFTLAFLAGCDGAPNATGEPASPSQTAAADTPIDSAQDAGSRVADTPTDVPRADQPARSSSTAAGSDETWDVCRIQGDKVGYVRTRISTERMGDETVERIDMEHVLSFARFGQEVRQEMHLSSWERPNGEFLKFESRVMSGREVTLSRGRVEGGKLTMESTTPGKTQTKTIDWKPEWGGFYATERALRGAWKPGQRKTIRAFVPVLHQVGTSEISAEAYEAVRIEGRSQSLLKLRRVDTLGAVRLESTIWIDERGQSLKSFISIPAPGMETVRTSREVAVADAPASQFDLGTSTVVKVKGMPADPHAATQLKLRASLTDGSIDDLFANGASQTVRKLDDRQMELALRAIRPDTPLAAPETGPNDADRASNGFIQSDDPAIIAFAREVAEGETDPWKVAVALESLVRKRVRTKNFTQAMATAAEVVRSGEGDCTEHAVLLAAACRARGIPARVAIGLIYVPTLDGFAYHMWNEVWIVDRWVPLDATLARGGIGVGHVKLLVSPLDGVDAYAAFLPVFQVLGRLKLEVAPIAE